MCQGGTSPHVGRLNRRKFTALSLLDRLRVPWIIFLIMDALCSEATNLNLHSINRTFVFRGQPVFTTQPINPAWRPCYRRAPEIPIVSTVMRKVHGITFHFLNYLWRAGVRGQPAPVMARPPETPPNYCKSFAPRTGLAFCTY